MKARLGKRGGEPTQKNKGPQQQQHCFDCRIYDNEDIPLKWGDVMLGQMYRPDQTRPSREEAKRRFCPSCPKKIKDIRKVLSTMRMMYR